MSTTPATFGGSGATLLSLTAVCWLALLVYLFSVVGKEVHGDAAFGQGVAWLGVMVFGGFTWLWLGGLLLKAGTQDMMPGWAQIAALVFYMAAGAAGVGAFYLLQNPQRVWPVVVPVVLPALLAFYVFALYQPSLRPLFSDKNAGAVVWGAVLLLTLAPGPAVMLQLQGKSIAREVQTVQQTHATQQRRTENLALLQTMTPDKPLSDWFDLLKEENGVRPEALDALRHVERRQGDVEEMLSYGMSSAMRLLPLLDLQATPKLCEAARAYMLKQAKETRVRPKQDPREYVAGGYVEDSLAGIAWLQAHGCDCEEGLAAMEASVGTFLDTPARKAALASLAALRKKQ